MRKRSAEILLLALVLLAASQFAMVAAETDELFDETVQVGNLNYFTITRTVSIEGKNNVRLTGQIDVISGGDITVYVMDSDGYQQFQAGGRARESALYAADNVASQTIDVALSKSGPVHVVLDNTGSLLTTKSVRVRLSLTYDTPFFTTEVIAGIGIAVVAVAVAAFFLMRRKGSAKPATVMQPVLTQGTRKNCIYCGALMHEMARTCPACGKEQPT
jgi:hypothetical protein